MLIQRVGGLECCGKPGGGVWCGGGQRGPDGFGQVRGVGREDVRGGGLAEFGQQCPGPRGVAGGGAMGGERRINEGKALQVEPYRDLDELGQQCSRSRQAWEPKVATEVSLAGPRPATPGEVAGGQGVAVFTNTRSHDRK
jgi:hypothetical protein